MQMQMQKQQQQQQRQLHMMAALSSAGVYFLTLLFGMNEHNYLVCGFVTALFAVPISIYLWKKVPFWQLALLPSVYVLAMIILAARGQKFF